LTLEGCPEASVRNYRYTLRNITEENRSQHIGSKFKGETVAWERVDWSGSGEGQVVACFVYGNKLSDCTKCGEFL